MSVVDFAPGDSFTVAIIKHHLSNPELKWANNYELYSADGGETDALTDAAALIVDFEKRIHHNYVIFENARISTWIPDSKPYDPEAFVNVPLTGAGATTPLADPVALTVTLSVVRQVNVGRLGHVFYRGCLLENQVSSPAGIFTLTSPGDLDLFIQAAVTASGIDALFEVPGPGGLNMAMINNTGPGARIVEAFQVKGVTSLPLNHAWFNRTSPAPSSA
jgi:hypothetical protein